MAATPEPTAPITPRDFTPLGHIYAQARLAHLLRARDARRALRALCAEQDTERERYRQETIERAQMDGAE